MFHTKTKTIIFFLLFLLCFSSCAEAQVLGLRQQRATELFKQGDLDFIIRAQLPADFSGAVSRLQELMRIHPAAPFYAGLIVGNMESAEQNRRLQILLFSAAIESPSPPVRREAALKLTRLILESERPREVQSILNFLAPGTSRRDRAINERSERILLRAACLYRLGRYSEALQLLPANPDGQWEKALALFATWKASGGNVDKTKYQEIMCFLFDLPTGDLRRWAYAEALSIDEFLSPEEHGIIFSRHSPARHIVTLANLQPALSDGGLLFFRYPRLIGDLTRAYQFTPLMREEGLTLLGNWDRMLEYFSQPLDPLEANNNFEHPIDPELETFLRTLDKEAINARRYFILHHAGRIERARGRFPISSEYFMQALQFAPDTTQADACIWYILTNTLTHNPSSAAAIFISTIPKWTDMSVFNGLLDQLSRYLTTGRHWNTLLQVFFALESKVTSGTRPGAAYAQYAWIVGRAIQEGFLVTERSAESFFRIAFEEESASFYYRTMAALKLGENLSPINSNQRTGRRPPPAPVRSGGELEFLLGFFEYSAASFALPFIRSLEGELSIPELRRLAARMAEAEQWQESLRLVSRYMRRDGFQTSREDLYLSHPRPFVEQIERHARKVGIGPEIMFALIRTESFFGADAVSHAGAVGLAQLMPTTAQDIATRIVRAGGPDHRSPNGINLTDPEVNIHLGSFYLRHLIYNQMDGSPMLALMAYNGGQGRVRRWVAADRARAGGSLPKDLFLETIIYPETRQYGRLVLSAAAIYGYLYYEMSMEEVAVNIFRQ
ncbi:MAG: lytic transglycosylase domain-containing protein [Spirochaetaceae bacterium]|nr:lytic transglycosylase domain-containing protein [Spirochaetaceae bacterium]